MAGRAAINDFLGGGAGPLPNGSPGGGGLVAFPFESFVTPILDLTKAQLGVEIVPAKPGHVAVILATSLWFIEQVAGTQTSPPTLQAGSDPAHTNSIPSSSTTPSNADVATSASILPALAVGPTSQSAAVGVRRFVNAPIILDVTAGAQGTGGFSLKARFQCRVIWMAA